MQAFKAEFATDGTDWDFIPYDTMIYGGGGIGGWASLCGVPNGCVHLLNLIGLHGALGSDVMGHYCKTQYPTSALPDLYYADAGYGPSNYPYVKQPIADDEVLAHTTSYNPLCHVSISKFCYAAGINLVDMGPHAYAHKADRCGKIVADLAATTAELINYYALNGASADPYSIPEQTADCLTCHTTSSNAQHIPAQTGKMDCYECHTYGSVHQERDFAIVDTWTEDGGGSPATEFAPGDTIKYCVEFAIMGGGVCYVESTDKTKARGPALGGTTWVRRLNADVEAKAETRMSGTGIWKWTDTVPSNATTGNCRFLLFFRVRNYENGPMITMLEANPKFHVTRP